MKLIPLTGKYAVGKYAFAIVDDDMYEELRMFKWKAKPNGRGTQVYAVRNHRVPDGRLTTIRMHRVVLGAPWDGVLDIDHINRNPVDNRRINLRLVSRSVNTRNTTNEARQNRSAPLVAWKLGAGAPKYLCHPYFCRVNFGTCRCGKSFRKMISHQKYCSESCKQKAKYSKWKTIGYAPPSAYKKKSVDVGMQA